MREALDVREDRPKAPQLQGKEHIFGDVGLGLVGELQKDVGTIGKAVVARAFFEEAHDVAVELDFRARVDADGNFGLGCHAGMTPCLLTCGVAMMSVTPEATDVRSMARDISILSEPSSILGRIWA